MILQKTLEAVPQSGSSAPFLISGASVDWTQNVLRKALTGNTTFTFANVVSGDSITLYVTQSAGNSYGVNWPVGITWAGGSPPGVVSAGTSTRVVLTATSGSTFTAVFYTGATVPINSVGTVADFLGQKVLVEHSDGTKSQWEAMQVNPTVWHPTSDSIIWNRDLLQWERMFSEDETFQSEILPDQ